jgi:hypothetical protein
VFVSLGAAARRDGEQLHVDALRTDGFCRDGRGIHEALFALKGFARLNYPAGGDGDFINGRHGVPPNNVSFQE